MRAFDHYVGVPVCKHIIPVWVHPNHLSVIRGLFVIPIIIFRHVPWAGTYLIIASALFDIFDGVVARVRGQTSELGASLDAGADKVLVLPSLWSVCGVGVSLSICLPVTAVELALVLIRPLKRWRGVTTRSNSIGGLKTWVQNTALAFVFTHDPFYTRLVPWAFALAILLAVGSLIGHLLDFRRKPCTTI